MTELGERLRRRLYRPGAAEEDVEAYLSVAELEPDPEPEEDSLPPLPPWRPTRAAVVVAVVLVLVVAGSALVLQVVHAQPPVAGPAPLPTHFVEPDEAAAFESALERGDDAGLGPWWDSTAPFVEQHGTGDGTVLLPVSASGGGGRLTVLLVLAHDGVAGWTASRLVIHDDRTIHLQTEASDYGSLRAGVPAIGRLDYTALHRPLRLFVQAPAGTRWGVAAVIAG